MEQWHLPCTKSYSKRAAMRKSLLLILLLPMTLLVVPRTSEAQRPQIQASALGATGVSVGMGSGNSIVRRSATAVAVQVTGSNSERPALRYGGTLRGEVEGKVTFGIVPQIAYIPSFGRFSAGIIGGIPLVIAPKSLYGVEVGGHFGFSITDWVAVVAQAYLSFYPLGNDLPDDSFLLMVQFYAGFEFHF
jgi:hypothetical protein